MISMKIPKKFSNEILSNKYQKLLVDGLKILQSLIKN